MNVTRKELVATLAKPGDAILSSLDAHKCHMLHMAVGLVDEAIELIAADSRANVLEELGHCRFYLEGILQGMDWTLVAPSTVELANVICDNLALLVITGNVIGDIKRYAIQGKPLDEAKLHRGLEAINEQLLNLAAVYGFTEEEIHADNVRKLGTRYAGLKYSDEAAAIRADKPSGE